MGAENSERKPFKGNTVQSRSWALPLAGAVPYKVRHTHMSRGKKKKNSDQWLFIFHPFQHLEFFSDTNQRARKRPNLFCEPSKSRIVWFPSLSTDHSSTVLGFMDAYNARRIGRSSIQDPFIRGNMGSSWSVPIVTIIPFSE